MPEVEQLPVIKRLPAQLANQIAAGEVIERPASVLKELIENALDARATRIDIELVNGGMEYITVIDNGHGVMAEEMPLAISRHATSKIESVEDLQRLHSLGFRGEALASICAVSQWEMISRPHSAQRAMKLSHQLPDAVMESHHAPGTRVSIKQLFYNTPARRKFLRAERTEYRHCDDVIKRMALACFDVAFYVKHNGRQTLKLPAVNDDIGRSRRVAQVCGESFIRQSWVVDYPHSGMRLWGWVSQAEYSRQSSDLQFFYINGRIIRDRVINHAIRVAYQDHLPPGRHAAYVLHLELDPVLVDVNVHPSKHEVRFRESRRIHDFISRNIRDALQQQNPVYPSDKTAPINQYSLNQILPSHTTVQEQASLYQVKTESRFGSLLTLLHNRFALMQQQVQQQNQLFLIDLQLAAADWIGAQWNEAIENAQVKSLPLLIPERLTLSQKEITRFHQFSELMGQIGFDLNLIENNVLLIKRIPSLLHSYNSGQLVKQLFALTNGDQSLAEQIVDTLSQLQPDVKKLDFPLLLSAIEELDTDGQYWRQIHANDLRDWLHK